MSILKPDLTRVWADQAGAPDVVDPGDPKFHAGWVAEIPTYQNFNFLQQMFTQGLAYFNQQGVGIWDADTTYPAIFGLAKGATNGYVYQSVVEQSGNDPESDNGTNWILWYTNYSDMKSGRKNILDNAEFAVWQNSPSFSVPTVPEITADRWRSRGGDGTGGIPSVTRSYTDANAYQMDVTLASQTGYYYISQRLELFHKGVAPFSQRTFTLTVVTDNTAAADWELNIGIGGVNETPAPPIDDEGHQILLEAVNAQIVNVGLQTTSFTFTVPDLSSYTLTVDSFLVVFLRSTAALPNGTYRFKKIQLEEGSRFTSFEQYDAAADRSRCNRMRQVYTSSSSAPGRLLAMGWERVNDQIEFLIPLTENLRTIPTVNFGNFTLSSRVDGEINTLSNFTVSAVESAGLRVRADVTISGAVKNGYAAVVTILGAGILVFNADL